MLRTHFTFPDGDGYPFHLAEAPAGGLRLSDLGHTLMHISYEHDIDTFLTGTRGMLLERIVGESGILYDEGVFSLETSAERLPEAIFGFGQALTRIYDLTLLSRTNVGSTFYDDLADYLTSFIDEAMERDHLPAVPAEAYPVDYRIEGSSDVPLYGVPNRARLTTIMLAYFHRPGLRVDHRLQGNRPGPTFRCRGRNDLIARIDLTSVASYYGEKPLEASAEGRCVRRQWPIRANGATPVRRTVEWGTHELLQVYPG